MDSKKEYASINTMIGDAINVKHIKSHWDEILRPAASIKQGTVIASLILRKFGSYPRQNGLAIALREIGRIEHTLFTLDWLQNIELRRRVNTGLNKGEVKNTLARAVFFQSTGRNARPQFRKPALSSFRSKSCDSCNCFMEYRVFRDDTPPFEK